MSVDDHSRDDAPDRELLASWCAGDPRGLERLYAKYHAGLTRFFTSKVRQVDVDELLQQTWTVIVEARDAFAAGLEGVASTRARRSIVLTSSFHAYLLGVARNKTLEYYRRRQKSHNSFDPKVDTILELEPSLSLRLRLRERLERVQMALHMLPLEQQTLLELKMFDDLSGREIAAIYDIPVSTAKSRITRARAEFDRHLARIEKLYAK